MLFLFSFFFFSRQCIFKHRRDFQPLKKFRRSQRIPCLTPNASSLSFWPLMKPFSGQPRPGGKEFGGSNVRLCTWTQRAHGNKVSPSGFHWLKKKTPIKMLKTSHFYGHKTCFPSPPVTSPQVSPSQAAAPLSIHPGV